MQRAGISAVLALALALIVAGCNKGEENTQTNAPPAAPGPASPGPGAPAAGGPGGGPTATTGNAVLTSKVKNELMTQGVDTTKVEVVTTADGVVTLKGSVHKPEQKTVAEKAAKKI